MPYYRVKLRGLENVVKTINVTAPNMSAIEKHYGDSLLAVILPISKIDIDGDGNVNENK